MTSSVRRGLCALVMVTGCALRVGMAGAAEPDAGAGFVAPGPHTVEVRDLDLGDATRPLPVRVRVPQPCTSATPRPMVLFSHGLGGSREGGRQWGEHWASHGFVVVHLQHPGSDESLWRGQPGGFADLRNLRVGMTAEQALRRVEDVRRALDALEPRRAIGPPCVDPGRVGMSGHSFGAQTTQAVAGQSLLAFPAPARESGLVAAGGPLREPRVRAAIAFSPAARDDSDAARATLASIAVPMLVVTGSRDDGVALTGVTPELRRKVFDALPPGRRYLLWFESADHMVFNGGTARPRFGALDAHVHRVAAAVGLAFWKAALEADPAAARWLADDGPRALLRAGDQWAR